MDNIRQSMRPRHQVLTLKCYPRFQRGAVEVKPNSSELSYLLYYASTRRSKLHKVGAFLEKKTENDLWRNKSGNVLVTLQILQALIEKCARDLPLFSFFILRVLESVLKGTDVGLVEESVAVWTAFCLHYDATQLFADHDHNAQLRSILALYTSCASKSAPPRHKGQPHSVPIALRYRTAGLRAVKALVSSPSFLVEDGNLCAAVVPVILENIYSDEPGHLARLQDREDEKQRQEKEYALKRRQSTTIARGTLSLEHDASAAAGTTEDIDQRADEEAAVLALQAFRQVFSGEARSQVRVAATRTIAFVKAHDTTTAFDYSSGANDLTRAGWSGDIFELMCRWTAVQDRFIILVCAVEALVTSPIVEDDLRNQLKLTHTVRWLLHSSVNFIGLSVMDVLVGLLQHILLLLQLGGEGSQLRPHPQQSTKTVASPADSSDSSVKPSSSLVMEIARAPSETRKQLLVELQHCIGELSTHVYYTDQIEDMVAAILSRLKPSHVPGLENTVSAMQDPVGAAETIADSVSLRQKPQTDGFFSFDTARILALGAVRDVIVVANSRKGDAQEAVDRNPVDIAVWEGTQWLLRDPDMRVRGAYVEALLCWLDLELEKQDLRASTARKSRTKPRTGGISRRATSNASRQSPSRGAQSHFLQLLHLAIHDGAVEYAESEPDVLMLHLLLYHLIRNLGVNSVRSGLPMIYALQDEVKGAEGAKAQVALGSLVHGYFWALSDCFNFDTSRIGRAIFEEINARTLNGAWMTQIYVPPLAFDKIPLPPPGTPVEKPAAATPELNPLGYRREIVERIGEAYSGSILSPPTSPVASPDRPILSPGFSTASVYTTTQAAERALPAAFKEDMLASWSREDCIATAQRESVRESVRAQSVAGSRHGSNPQVNVTNGAGHNGLAHSRSDANMARTASTSRAPPGQSQVSPRSVRSYQNPRVAIGMVHGTSHSPSVVRVSHLKQILAGNDVRPSLNQSRIGQGIGSEDEDDNSTMMSIDFTNESFIDVSSIGPRPGPVTSALQGTILENTGTAETDHAYTASDSIPPVPQVPALDSAGPQLAAPVMGSGLAAGINEQLAQGEVATTTTSPRQTQSKPSSASTSLPYTSGTGSRADLDRLLGSLGGIGLGAGDGSATAAAASAGRAARPPF